jgi:hypothetical protein
MVVSPNIRGKSFVSSTILAITLRLLTFARRFLFRWVMLLCFESLVRATHVSPLQKLWLSDYQWGIMVDKTRREVLKIEPEQAGETCWQQR